MAHWRRIGYLAVESNGTSQKSTDSSDSFNITAAGGSTIPIPAGEYYFNTKARSRRMMKNSLSNTARRVYACLELMTMGWKQELAVVSKDVNATREDISERTGIAVQHVSAALSELHAQGLAECRESTTDKRKVEIYSWATPRAVEVQNPNVATFVIPEWVPDTKYLRSFLRRSHKKTYENLDHLDETSRRSYLDELTKAAQEMEKAELRMSRLLDPNVADPDIYKEDRTDRNIERTEHTHTPVASVVVCEPVVSNGACAPVSSEQPKEPERSKPPKAPAFDPKPSWETFWATYTRTKDARKQDAWEWWRDTVKSAEYAVEILDGLNRHVASDQWQRKIGVPDAINFLLKHRYKERPLPASAVIPPQTKSERQAAALAQFAAKIREQPA